MELDALILAALSEDLKENRDLTTDLFVPADTVGNGWIEARAVGIVCGLEVAESVFRSVDASVQLERLANNGDAVKPLDRVLNVSGPASAILRAERTVLNFLCHLSGVATLTREFVERTRRWNTKILCTRKTTPGLRDLEIEAIRHGGGDAYRTNLSNAVLIKDNHLGIIGGMKNVAATLAALWAHDSDAAKRILVEGKIEVSSLADIEQAYAMGWRHMLLDNFSIAEAAEAATRWKEKVTLEISGGITLENVAGYAATGVQAISVGALTHSAKALDFSLEVEWRRP